MSNPLRDPVKSSRHMDVEYDTPFNDKGVCHHHPNVQMATKKFKGGWKILMTACPRCIEAKYEEDEGSVTSSRSGASSRRSSRSRNRNKDDLDESGSVSSRSSKRSVTSRTKPVSAGSTFDKNGCCINHPTVQIAKKKLLGGYKEFRSCPKCLDPSYDDMADNVSISSKSSRKSTTSFRSTGSARSRKSAKSIKSNSSPKGCRKTDRYGALPFDEEGYCHAHPSIRLAKKKALGGWKVLHDICPDCADDCCSTRSGRSRRSSRSGMSRRSRSSSKKKGTGRYFDDSGSDTSSYKSGKSGGTSSSTSRKKKIRVKDMRYQDEHGKEGKYSGDVNEDHQPHGQGKMKYKDGSVFSGVFSEGTQVHGKTSKKSSSSGSGGSSLGAGKVDGGKSGVKSSSSSSSRSGKKSSSSKDWARRDAAPAPTGKDGKLQQSNASVANTVLATNKDSSKMVRKMKWLDYYGDPGLYTGEVDSSSMPNGKGSMKYDHGLIQEGLWTKGQFVEGSDLNTKKADGTKKSGGRTSGSGERSKKSSASASQRSSGGKRMDP